MKSLMIALLVFTYSIAGAQKFEWVKNLYATHSTHVQIVDIEINGKNEIYVLCNFEDTIDVMPGPGKYLLTSHGQKDFFIAKYSKKGSLITAYAFGNSQVDDNLSDETAGDMVIDSAGSLYVIGTFEKSFSLGPPQDTDTSKYKLVNNCDNGMFVAKISPELRVQWARGSSSCKHVTDSSETILVRSAITGEKIAYSPVHDAVLVAGHFTGAVALPPSGLLASDDHIYRDLYFAHMSASGDGSITMARPIKSVGPCDESLAQIVVSHDGQWVFLAGDFDDANPLDLHPTSRNQLAQAQGRDIFIGCYEITGHLVYQGVYNFNIGGHGDDYAVGLDIDKLGNVYLAGTIGNGGTANFHLRGESQRYTAMAKDAFVAVYDGIMRFKYMIPFSGVGDQGITAVKIDKDKNICVTGWFENEIDLNPKGNPLRMKTEGTKPNLFFGKYNSANGQAKTVQRLGGVHPMGLQQALGANYHSHDMVLMGNYSELLDFNPDEDGIALSLPEPIGGATYLARYSDCIPTIAANNPTDITTCEGETVTFSYKALQGTGLTYQWRYNGADLENLGNVSGADNHTLHIRNVGKDNEGLYSCVVNSTCWTNDTSHAAALLVNKLPVIISHPTSEIICEGVTQAFFIEAEGDSIAYQWLVNKGNGIWQDVPGNGKRDYYYRSLTADMNYDQYRCVVTGLCHPPLLSHSTTIQVTPITSITSQPVDVTTCEGTSTSFSVEVTGANLTYQWQRSLNEGVTYVTLTDNSTFNGSNSPTLSISKVPLYINNCYFRCVITGDCDGYEVSKDGILTVLATPKITMQPTHVQVCEHSSAEFSIEAAGTDIRYQWQINTDTGYTSLNNNHIYTNVKTPVLHITTATANLNGSQYRCMVSGVCSPQAMSGVATLTVATLPEASLTTQGSPVFCQGDSIVLLANTGTGLNYSWQKNYVHIPSQATERLTVNSSGNYKVMVTDTNGCSSTSAPAVLMANVLPEATVSALGSTEFCLGHSVQLLAGSGSGYAYQWRKNGVNIHGAKLSSYVTTTAGNFSVQVTDADQCSNTSSELTVTTSPLPVANAGPDKSVPNGGRTVISGAGSGGTGALTYQWTPIGFIDSGAYLSHMITSRLASSQVYSLMVEDEIGCRSYDNLIVYVTGGPLDVSAYASATTLCKGDSVKINALASGGTGQYTYSWSSTPASFASAAVSAIVSPTVTTTYLVIASDGYYIDSANVIIRVNNAPAAIITPDNSTAFCEGSSVRLDAMTGPGYTYTWSKDNVVIDRVNASTHTAREPGYYIVKITDKYGCSSASLPEKVEVLPLPKAVITPLDETSFCPGGTIDLLANTGTGLSYRWLKNNVTLAEASEATIRVNTSGHYSVQVFTPHGCSRTSAAVGITELESPQVEISVLGDTAFCPGQSVVLTAPTGLGRLYQWHREGAALPGKTASSLTVNESGLYSIKATGLNGCSALSAPVMTHLLANPDASLSLSANTICLGDTAVATVAANEHYVYYWKWNGTELPDELNHAIDITRAGQYSVSIADLATGCSAQSQKKNVIAHSLPVPILTADGTLGLCTADTAKLQTWPDFNRYLWNTSQTTQSINASTAGWYTVTVSDANACQATATLRLEAERQAAPDICMVSVSQSQNFKYNVVVWDNTQGENITQFNIYRMSHLDNTYQLIGRQNAWEEGIFTDYASNPSVKSDFYKISMVDTCGNESDLSQHHKTIHLTRNQGIQDEVNLIWENYQGLPYSSYLIYRGPHPDTLTVLDTVSNLITTYTDQNPPTRYPVYYNIRILLPEICAPRDSLQKGPERGPYGFSMSNMEDAGKIAWTADSVASLREAERAITSLTVFPNPFIDKTTLRYGLPSRAHVIISLRNVLGQEITTLANEWQEAGNKFYEVSTSKYGRPAGVYFLHMQVNNHTVVTKLMEIR